METSIRAVNKKIRKYGNKLIGFPDFSISIFSYFRCLFSPILLILTLLITLLPYYLITCFSCLYAASNSDTFSSACDFYKKSDFEGALESFKILEKGCQSAEVFYNIGNTYFRLGKVGLALVYYERAQNISPFDEDVDFNIKFVSGMIKDTDYERGFISKIKLSSVKLLFAFCFFIFAVVISAKIVKLKENTFWFLVVSSLVSILFLCLYVYRYQIEKEVSAVVVANTVEVRSGPDETFKVNLTLPEGKKLLILGKTGDWFEIGIKSLGAKGWIEKKYVEVV